MPRLPDLGPRGEGWVAGQALLIGAVALLGLPGLADLPPSDAGRWALLGLGLVLLAAGAGVGIRGARDLGSSLTAVPRPRDDATLVETGIYAHVRHPLYLAVVLAAAGWSAATASPAAGTAALALAGWLAAKATREEAWLVERFPGYAAYRDRTARFIPGLY